MGTLDGWLFVGEVFAILLCFWALLMWVLARLDTRLEGCSCRNGGWDPMCRVHHWKED